VIFVYNRLLAFKYILFGIFLLIVIGLTAPLGVVIPLILLADLILGWMAIINFVRVSHMFSNKYILSREGINFYHFNHRVKTIPWEIIDSYSATEGRVVIKIAKKFIYITNELKEYHMFKRIITQVMEEPIDKKGKEFPWREDLEKIKDPNRLRINFQPPVRRKIQLTPEGPSQGAEFLGGNLEEFSSKALANRPEDSSIHTGEDLEMFGEPETDESSKPLDQSGSQDPDELERSVE
jgi:hypothetical protein